MINFTSKTVTAPTPSTPIPISRPISERISSNMYSTFSNLNFSGVYRLGSEANKSECFIGSAYNITLKVTHHLNLLMSGKHHCKSLQEWVNKNGIETLDISILAQTKSNPDDFEVREQFYINLIKPKFNSVVNKRKITYHFKEVVRPRYVNSKARNLFSKPIISDISKNYNHHILKITSTSDIDEERKLWKPTRIWFEEGQIIRKRGDNPYIKPNKKVEVIGTVVKRTTLFNAR